jgi:hypothetical protein
MMDPPVPAACLPHAAARPAQVKVLILLSAIDVHIHCGLDSNSSNSLSIITGVRMELTVKEIIPIVRDTLGPEA